MRKTHLLALSFLFPTVVFAAAGTPDSTFSGDGLMTARIRTGNYSGNSNATSVVLQSDGKIVTAGYARESGGDQFALARFTAQGVLDSSFGPSGSNGAVITDLTECSSERIHAMALQSDQKIVVGGYCHQTTSNKERFVVARYKTDGTLDSTFSGDGIEMVDSADTSDWRINALILQSDEKILVAGYSTPPSGSGCALLRGNRFVLSRFTTEGVLDTTFGPSGDGYAFIPFGSPIQFNAEANTLAIQSDGKIVVGGNVSHLIVFAPALARCADANCQSLDSGFGNIDGTVTTGLTNYGGTIKSLVIQSDGKILAVGTALAGSGAAGNPLTMDLLLVRYDSAGVLDPTFESNSADQPGVVIKSLTDKWFMGGGITLQSDQKIVATGYSLGSGSGENRSLEFVLARINGGDGSLDSSFSEDGLLTIPLGQTEEYQPEDYSLLGLSRDIPQQVLLDSSARIIAAGFSHDGIRERFAVARIWDRDASDPEITSFTSNKDRVVRGSDLDYTVSYKNRTGDLAQGVVITVRLSLPVELVAGDHGCTAQSASDGSMTITCPRSNVATTGPDHQLSFTVKPSVIGALVAAAEVRTGGHDITPTNSTRSLSVTVDETAVDDPEDDPDDPADEPDDGEVEDDTPQPPPEFRERRSFEISEPAVEGEEGGGGGCSFVPGTTSSSKDLLWILLGSVPLFLLSLKELIRKKSSKS